jgi:hypothetical protein
MNDDGVGYSRRPYRGRYTRTIVAFLLDAIAMEAVSGNSFVRGRAAA